MKALAGPDGREISIYPIDPGIPLGCGAYNLGAPGSVTSLSGSPWNSGQRARCLRAQLVVRDHTWTGHGALLSRLRHWQASPSFCIQSLKMNGQPQPESAQWEMEKRRLVTTKVQTIKFNFSFWMGKYSGQFPLSCQKGKVRGSCLAFRSRLLTWPQLLWYSGWMCCMS